ncbi:MATE family efflux transporter [Pontibacter sp. G13]|uniref:MATE family efflux transporter n=1 Tax=Pontibacter sp. G13 TaxID=3074898 RepID=UPI002889D913|nr:MATE family efflux transporter [Pontibacter sp. G13]WNJ16793.1 MATE family efflux transporter [Pontibacter sp. G13]
MDKSPDLLSVPLGPYLVRGTLQLFVGMMAVSSLTLVDAWFIGKIGPQALQAIGFATPILLVGMNAILGLGTGITSVLGHELGSGGSSTQSARFAATILSLLLGGFLAFGGWLFNSWICEWMGVPVALQHLLNTYLYPMYGSWMFLAILMGQVNLVRAEGNTQTPLIVMIAVLIANILLDPLLIFGWGIIPALGLAGAGWATCLSLIIGILVAWGQGAGLAFGADSGFSKVTRRILKTAIPAGTSRILFPFAHGVTVQLLAQIGAGWVGAHAIGFRLDLTLLMIMVALSATIGPLVSMHAGASSWARLRKAIQIHWVMILILGGTLSVTLTSLAPWIGMVFTDSEPLQDQVATYYQLVPWGYIFHGGLITGVGILYALERPLVAWIISATHLFGVYVPLMLVCSNIWKSEGILLAWPISACIGCLGCWIYMNRLISE